MQNMSYFCTVKYFRCFLTVITTCLTLVAAEASNIISNDTTRQAPDRDSIEISLLTCAPGREVYSLYGHTAIRVKDSNNGIDLAVNYGVFSFKKPYFILRFIFGLTDYEMGIMPFNEFCEEYKIAGREVFQQVLNLTQEEKLAIAAAIQQNYLPENRTYRYNYFYDNCTTRARDIITENINGPIVYPDKHGEYPSFRELIHRFNDRYPWARFGNDILLGVKADAKTTRSEHEFLPLYLMKDFSNAQIIRADGKAMPLATNQSDVVLGSVDNGSEKFPLRPISCAWIFFAVVLAMTTTELIKKKRLVAFDIILMFLDGCLGLLIFIMFFSQHPTTSTNLHIFILNPIPLFFIWTVAKKQTNKTQKIFWIGATISILLFYLGGIFQDYAEGTYILALSLLIRCLWNILLQEKIISFKNVDK